jgi:hypothetical protein
LFHLGSILPQFVRNFSPHHHYIFCRPKLANAQPDLTRWKCIASISLRSSNISFATRRATTTCHVGCYWMKSNNLQEMNPKIVNKCVKMRTYVSKVLLLILSLK